MERRPAKDSQAQAARSAAAPRLSSSPAPRLWPAGAAATARWPGRRASGTLGEPPASVHYGTYALAAVEILTGRVLLRPTDLDRSLRFYEQTIGLAIYREWGTERRAASFLRRRPARDLRNEHRTSVTDDRPGTTGPQHQRDPPTLDRAGRRGRRRTRRKALGTDRDDRPRPRRPRAHHRRGATRAPTPSPLGGLTRDFTSKCPIKQAVAGASRLRWRLCRSEERASRVSRSLGFTAWRARGELPS